MIQIGNELINPADVEKVGYTENHPNAPGRPSVLSVTINGVQTDYWGTDTPILDPATRLPTGKTKRDEVNAAWAQLKPAA